MRALLVVTLCAISTTAAAQAPVAVESVEADSHTACTAEGTTSRISITCRDTGTQPTASELPCATLLSAELLPDAGIETLVECGNPRDGESRIAFAIFAGAQLRWVLQPSFEYGARIEIVDLLERGSGTAPRFELVVHLGSEEGSDVLVFAARAGAIVRVFRAYLGGGGDPVRELSFVLSSGSARIELRSGRARPEIWRFDPITFAYTH